MNIGFYLGFYKCLFWVYSFITIPVVVLNNVVQNIHNILFILIEKNSSRLISSYSYTSVIEFLVCIPFGCSCPMLKFHYLPDFFLNFEDWFLIN